MNERWSKQKIVKNNCTDFQNREKGVSSRSGIFGGDAAIQRTVLLEMEH